MEGSKVLHFGSVSLTPGIARNATIFAARHAHQNGVLVSYDPNYRASLWKNPGEAIQWMTIPLPVVDIIKVSEEELEMLTGTADLEEGTRLLEERGIALVLVTLGEKGSFCRWKGRRPPFPAYPSRWPTPTVPETPSWGPSCASCAPGGSAPWRGWSWRSSGISWTMPTGRRP